MDPILPGGRRAEARGGRKVLVVSVLFGVLCFGFCLFFCLCLVLGLAFSLSLLGSSHRFAFSSDAGPPEPRLARYNSRIPVDMDGALKGGKVKLDYDYEARAPRGA